MTCQYLCTVCLLCSLVMTPPVRSLNVGAKSLIYDNYDAPYQPRSNLDAIPPVIISGPDFQEYFRPNHSRITLPCAATGTNPMTYKWMRNGELVKDNERIQIVRGSLFMHNPTADMQGYYQCFVSNSAGVAMSNVSFVQAAVLVSNEPARSVASSVNKSSGNPLVLPCSHVKKSIPAASFRWETMANGDFRDVHLDNRIVQTSDGSLVFNFVDLNDTGLYRCSAYNRILGMFKHGSKVNVIIEASDTSVMERKSKEAPVLLFSSPDTTTVEGKELHLTCLFGSWPLVYELEWTAPSGYTVINGSSFTIRNVSSARDEGVYTCRARKRTPLGNRVHSHTVNISVHIDAIPSFAIFPNDQEIVFGQNVTFTCQGHGRPAPVVTWYVNGTSVDEMKEAVNHLKFTEGQTSHLTLTEVHSTATVTCNISNVHGYRLHMATITSADQNGIHIITSPSSQSQWIQTSKLTTESPHKTVHILDDGTSMKPIEFQLTTAKTTSYITKTSFGVIVGVPLFLVVLCVIIVFYVRGRQKRRQDLVVSHGNQPQPPDDLINNNERIAYDSEDSGYDDLRPENPERRNLRQA